MGYPGVSSFPPLSTTLRSTIRSVFFWVKNFHCSRLLPFFLMLPSAVLSSLLHIYCRPPPPPPPLQYALWFFSGNSFTMGCFFFRELNPSSAPYSKPPSPPFASPICTFLCHTSSPKTATSCRQYAQKAAFNENEIYQTTEMRLYILPVPFHHDPAGVW